MVLESVACCAFASDAASDAQPGQPNTGCAGARSSELLASSRDSLVRRPETFPGRACKYESKKKYEQQSFFFRPATRGAEHEPSSSAKIVPVQWASPHCTCSRSAPRSHAPQPVRLTPGACTPSRAARGQLRDGSRHATHARLQCGPHSCAVVQPARDARQRTGATRPTAVMYEGDARGFGMRQGVNDSADPLVRRLAVGCLLARRPGACASARPDGLVLLSARPTLACIWCLRGR
jgi:hypothetical protein